MGDRGNRKGYTSIPLSFNRKMVIASVKANTQSAIHCVTEIDVTDVRHRIRAIHERGGPKYSFTAYLVKCLASVLEDFPDLNSFIKGRRLVKLEDITIGVLVERTLGEEKVPEPLAIRAVQQKSLDEIHGEIREAQGKEGNALGNLSGATWIRWIPSFLLNLFVRMADRNKYMAKKYGKVAVTAVGMFTKSATWFIPHGTATVLLTVGAISRKPVWMEDRFVPREMLHLTASFDHRIVDGAPAARFMKQYSEQVESGKLFGELDDFS
jgi:pyruvate/2-oxoglutarate dehydrogenase complex dihydrolipoamide acyltransferase (E2) component